MEKLEKLKIGDRLKYIREAQNKSPIEVATFLGISRQAYYNYEKNERAVNLATLKKLSEYFQVPIDSFMSEESEETRLSRITGLSAEAIRHLMIMKNHKIEFSDVFSRLIESDYFDKAIVELTAAKMAELQREVGEKAAATYSLVERLNMDLLLNDGNINDNGKNVFGYKPSVREVRDLHLYSAQNLIVKAFEEVIGEVWKNG